MTSPTSVGLVIVCTATVTTLMAPLVYRVLHVYQVFDVPNHRSSHDQPTVRGGGLACVAALFAVWAGSTAAGANLPHSSLLAASVLAGVGLADDVWGLPAAGRLLAQVAVGVTLGATLGGPGLMLLAALAFPIAVNAVNFMDGINGITGLTVAAWAVVVLIAGPGSTGSASMMLAALALGQALGFLPWNVPNAHMFLGDSGSYLFGALIAGAVLETQSSTGSTWLVAAPMAIYLFDTGFTLLSRASKRGPLLDAHREHLYQRLQVASGMSHLMVAAIVAAAGFACGLAVWINPAWGGIATLLICVGYTLVVRDKVYPAKTPDHA